MPSPAETSTAAASTTLSSQPQGTLPLDYYALLKIKRNASQDEIAQAYKSLSIRSHPDRTTSNQTSTTPAAAQQSSQRQFALLSEAYDVLSQPRWRALYDEHGEHGIKQLSNSSSSGSSNKTSLLGAGQLYSFTQDPLLMFERFHGHASAPAFTSPKAQQSSAASGVASVPAPLLINLYVSLEELLTGCSKNHKVHVQRLSNATTTSSAADASETVATEQILTVDIGAGWRDGTKITFQQLGDEAPSAVAGGSAAPPQRGAIIFTVRVKPHPVYTRSGDDIVHTLQCSLLQALTGAHTELTLLDGSQLNLSTQDMIASPTNEKVIKGQGLPRLNKQAPAAAIAAAAASKGHDASQQRGNLIIRFAIRFPESLSLEQKRALAQILPA